MSLSYSIIQGTLPQGMTLTATGLITGTVEPLIAPTWNTPAGRVATVNELASLAFTLSAAPTPGNSIVGYFVAQPDLASNAALPWGVRLQDNGVISGVAARGLNPEEIAFADDEIPVWTDSVSDNLGTLSEFHTLASATLAATARFGTAISAYLIVGTDTERPPFGFTLNVQTGVIGGIMSEETGPSDDILPEPQWATDGGLIGVLSEDIPSTIAVVAVPQRGSIVSYLIESGGVPLGMRLDPATGVIAGTPNPEFAFAADPFVPVANAPAFSTGSMLGTFVLGASVTGTIVATPFSPRTMAAYLVQNAQAMPLGMSLDRSTGVLSGSSPATLNAAGFYTFAVVALDSAGARAERNFIIRLT